jgi:hypothetical protein
MERLLRPKKSSGEELTPAKKVPWFTGTIAKSVRLEPWEGNWDGAVGSKSGALPDLREQRGTGKWLGEK